MNARTMDCDEARGLLVDRLKGEIRGRALETLEAHVAGCDACRRESRGLERTLDVATSIEPIEPREETWLRLKQRTVTSIAVRRHRTRRLLVWIALFLAPVLAVLVWAIRTGRLGGG